MGFLVVVLRTNTTAYCLCVRPLCSLLETCFCFCAENEKWVTCLNYPFAGLHASVPRNCITWETSAKETQTHFWRMEERAERTQENGRSDSTARELRSSSCSSLKVHGNTRGLKNVFAKVFGRAPLLRTSELFSISHFSIDKATILPIHINHSIMFTKVSNINRNISKALRQQVSPKSPVLHSWDDVFVCSSLFTPQHHSVYCLTTQMCVQHLTFHLTLDLKLT